MTLCGCATRSHVRSMSEGAARLAFHSIYTNAYELNAATTLTFDDYKVEHDKLNMDGIPFHQFTYTYTGAEHLTNGVQQFSVFVAPSELDSVFVESGKPFDDTPPSPTPGAQRINTRNLYVIETIGPRPKWIIFKNGRYDAGPNTADGVLEHFEQQTKERTAQGIFIYSKTEDFLKRSHDPNSKMYLNNPQWREGEKTLINELVAECEKRGITVWKNISLNLNGEWQPLTGQFTTTVESTQQK